MPGKRTQRSTKALDASAAALASDQHGLISRAQALELGFRRSAIGRRLRSRRWLRVRRGVYAFAGSPKTRKRDVLEACLAAGPDAVASTVTAAELHDFDAVWKRNRPHVLVPRTRRKRPAHVSVRRSLLHPEERTVVDGVPVTSPLRTLIDLVATLPRQALELTVMDAVRRKLVDADEFVATVVALKGSGRKGFAKLKAIVTTETFRQYHESRLESRTLQVIEAAGLPKPESGHVAVVSGERVAEIDFAYPDRKIAIFCDGRKYHCTEPRMAEDARQRKILRAAGWTVIVPTFPDVRGDARKLQQAFKDAFAATEPLAKRAPSRPGWMRQVEDAFDREERASARRRVERRMAKSPRR